MLLARFIPKLEAEHGATFRVPVDALRTLSDREWPGEIRELWTTVDVVANPTLAESAQTNLDSRSFVLTAEDFERYLADRNEVLGVAAVKDGEANTTVRARAPVAATEGAVRIRKPSDLTLEDVEAVLRQTNGNKTQAARELGIAFNTFQKVLARHRL